MFKIFYIRHQLMGIALSMLILNIGHANPAPDFKLPGKTTEIQLSSYKGKVVYLDFWASWCIPCRQSFPFMNQLQEKYAEQGLEIIAINLDSDIKKANNFLKIIPANFTIAYDPDGKVSKIYSVSVMPTLYLINRQGDIIYTHSGFRHSDNDKLENKIQEALFIENKKFTSH